MKIIGVDIGSSSVKVSIIDAYDGSLLATAFSPEKEMPIESKKAGWAEQDPESWFQNFKTALAQCLNSELVEPSAILAMGISYQMHGLVAVDKNHKIIRPSIIWCDSRAVEIGKKAFEGLGADYCSRNLLNSPGNFTASKLAWIKANEPANYEKIYKIMLPGDYLAMRLSGDINTTVSGMSEGIFWDFKSNSISEELFNYFGFEKGIIPEIVESLGKQATIRDDIATDLGLPKGVLITYRAGDQPNNAASLNVFNPGEIAATAGTSGVIYGVSDNIAPDKKSRVNMFAHINHSNVKKRIGLLACINGTGIMNSWIRKISGGASYNSMNRLAEDVNPGSDGIFIHPFGNGAERLLLNNEPGASIQGINLNIHSQAHLYRAVQESIAYSFRYAIDIMRDLEMDILRLRAGNANMFLSPLFGNMIASLSAVPVDLYNTDGSLGAARLAALGFGYYKSPAEAFKSLRTIKTYEPDLEAIKVYQDLYERWKEKLDNILTQKN